MRIDGARANFIRPDERALATTLIKAVSRHEMDSEGFIEQRNGIAVAWGGLDAAIADARGQQFILEEGADDLRPASDGDGVFFVGDHLGFASEVRDKLAAIGVRPVSVGPVSLHSDDVVTLVSNELDRVTSSP